jgi:TolB-like protein
LSNRHGEPVGHAAPGLAIFDSHTRDQHAAESRSVHDRLVFRLGCEGEVDDTSETGSTVLKEQPPTSSPGEPTADAGPSHRDAEPAAAALAQVEKRKNKVRTAWISFMGRVVAQVVGAAATIVFGLLLVQKYHAAPTPDAHPAPVARARGPFDPRVKSLAVLPIEDYSPGPQPAGFVNGLTEELITQLAQREDLRVISRTSSMRYKEIKKPLPDIARELRVDWIIEASLAVTGSRARVTAQLIDANTDEHVWARSYDRTISDPLSLQTEIAARVTADLAAALSPTRSDRPTGPSGSESSGEPSLTDQPALVAGTR